VRAQVNGLDAYVGTYQGQLQGLGNVAALAAAPTARISLRRQRLVAGPGHRVPERHVEKSPELAFAEPFFERSIYRSTSHGRLKTRTGHRVAPRRGGGGSK
jgi:hypothetical protein